MKTVQQIFDEAKELHARKSGEYGDTQKRFGEVLTSLCPGGVVIDDAKKAALFGIYFMMVHKMMRIISTDFRSIDSVRDLCVYSAMLEKEIEDEQ